MSLHRGLMNLLIFLFFIGVLVRPLEAAVPSEGHVIVENSPVVVSERDTAPALLPYRIRRSDSGFHTSLGYSQFNPEYYEPNYLFSNFEELYGGAETPLIELVVIWTWNLAVGSIGLESRIGYYNNRSDDPGNPGHELALLPLSIGVRLALDQLTSEPYFVPYAVAGGYTVLFEETLEAQSTKGGTQLAPYFGGGFMVQINTLDPVAAFEAYLNSGVENTSIFLEFKKFMTSSAVADNDFGTEVFLTAGLNLEF